MKKSILIKNHAFCIDDFQCNVQEVIEQLEKVKEEVDPNAHIYFDIEKSEYGGSSHIVLEIHRMENDEEEAERNNKINAHIEKFSDPEYQWFLSLKRKFED